MAGLLGWGLGSSNGILGNEFSLSGPEALPQQVEAQLAMDARERYAALMQRRNGPRGGYNAADFADPPAAATIMQLLQGAPPSGGPQGSPAIPPAMAPALPPPITIGQVPQPAQPLPFQGGFPGPQDPAALPQNATPSVGGPVLQAPPPQPGQAPSFVPPPTPEVGIGDRLSAGFNGFANSRGLLPAIGNLIGGLSTGARPDPQGQAQQAQALTTRAIYSALVSKGHDPREAMGIASAAAINPDIAKAILPEALGTKKAAGNLKLGDMEIPYTIGPNNNMQLLTPGGGGALNSLQDLIRFQQDNAARLAGEKTRAETIAKEQGGNQAALPTTLEKADEALALIEKIRAHPGRDYATGVAGVIPGIPGTQQRDFVTLLDQAKGQSFLQAFQSLKGGGQITEVEGRKATDAIARLDRAQSKEGFEAALNDLRDVIKAGRARAGELAGGARTPAADRPGLRPGTYTWSPHGGVQ